MSEVTSLNRKEQLCDSGASRCGSPGKGNGFIVWRDGAGLCNCSFHKIWFHNSSLEWWKYPNCSYTLRAVMMKFHMPMKIRRHGHKLICSLSLFPWNDSQGWVGEPGSPLSFPHTSTVHSDFPSLTYALQKENLESDWTTVLKFKEMLEIHHKQAILQPENLKCHLVQLPTHMWIYTGSQLSFTGTSHVFFGGGCLTSIISISWWNKAYVQETFLKVKANKVSSPYLSS